MASSSKRKDTVKAYEVLPDELMEVAPMSLLLSESVSGPSFSLPLGYILAVRLPPEMESAYRLHQSRPISDNDSK